jgi:formate dehydrogenase beta subunit
MHGYGYRRVNIGAGLGADMLTVCQPRGSLPAMDGGNPKPPRRGRTAPRGAALDSSALAEVEAALGPLPREKDQLIEALHLVHDRQGALWPRHLRAIAEIFGLPHVAPFEVATFYAHFDVLADDGAPAPPRTIRVCEGLPCAMAGAAALLAQARAAFPEARVLGAPCMGGCHRAPVASVGHRLVEPASLAALAAPVAPTRNPPSRPAWNVPAMPQDAMLERVRQAGLRGMGGAGFPTARKWALVAAQPGPRHVVVNADEGEPGTFKDRWCLEQDSGRVLDAMRLAATAVGADTGWVYLRDEYAHLFAPLRAAMTERESLWPGGLYLRRGAGAYICGEETALLESLEGKRGYPRHKPPFPGQVGLFGQPTLIHNVETLWWLPEILNNPAAFAASGVNGRSGKRLVSVSGRVRDPGVKEAPAGMSARAIIEQLAGGMLPGHQLRAFLPGGASGGMLPAALADRPLDFGLLDDLGCFVGSGALVVLSDQDDIVEAARNLVRFFRDESCGQCTPCRVGTAKAARLLEAPAWDRPLLGELAEAMADGSICGLGQAALNPVKSLLRFFPELVPQVRS